MRGRLFISDTVREMLCNAAYCGYVSGRRDKSKAIKGLHEAIVPDALFDRVQLMRRERARTLKPGRPSPKYVLRGLAHCKRCHANMQRHQRRARPQSALLLRHTPRQPLV
jgi:hypothetical protein